MAEEEQTFLEPQEAVEEEKEEETEEDAE